MRITLRRHLSGITLLRIALRRHLSGITLLRETLLLHLPGIALLLLHTHTLLLETLLHLLHTLLRIPLLHVTLLLHALLRVTLLIGHSGACCHTGNAANGSHACVHSYTRIRYSRARIPQIQQGNANIFRNRHILMIFRRIHIGRIICVHAILQPGDNSA